METWLVAIVITGTLCCTALGWRFMDLVLGRRPKGLEERLDRIEETLDQLGAGDVAIQYRAEIDDLQERVDFAERLLLQHRAGVEEQPEVRDVTPV